MKTYRLNRLIWLFLLIAGWIPVQGQSQMEVPGDNFSLEGALELFKKSSSPEEFERMLNDPESRVNNLDLNGDGYIDYIRVVDYNEGNVHAFVMQAAISDRESQDVAVITLEKMGDGKAILQITGDEDIYGVETIIEPTKEVRTYGGSTSSRVVVNVWAWPMVSYVYGPYYSAWISPWGWGYRPVWWSPWRPIVYYDYYSYWNPYRVHYSHCYTHRVVYAHSIYRPHRSTSVIVHTRHSNQISRYRSTRIDSNGRYNDNGRSGARSSSVRYNSNGRISASSSQRVSSGSSNSRTTRSSADYNRRSATSSGARESYSGSSGNSQRSATSPNVQRSTSRSSESTNSRGSSVNSGSKRSYSGSSSGSNSRSSSKPNVQRSTGRSSGGSDVSRPSSNSGSRQSYGRSSSGSSSRSSSGSSSSGRSSGSSGSQRSSGSSSGRGRH